jgi:hypothetical protein
MRYAAVLALALGGLLGLATTAQAGQQQMPAHWVNYHRPYYIFPAAEYWGPYGYAGMTDMVPCQPVNGIGPPPFGPRWWYQQPAQHNPWGPWRSPRDYFMTCPY